MVGDVLDVWRMGHTFYRHLGLKDLWNSKEMNDVWIIMKIWRLVEKSLFCYEIQYIFYFLFYVLFVDILINA